MPTAQLVPRCLCVVAPATYLWMTSSHLQPRIWLTILGRIWMTMVRCGAQIQERSQWRNQASKSSIGTWKREWSDRNDALKWSNTVLLVALLITTKALLLMRMWHGYVSRITVWILPPQALWPNVSLQAAAQQQISPCEDGMHRLDGCLRISIVGGYFSGT